MDQTSELLEQVPKKQMSKRKKTFLTYLVAVLAGLLFAALAIWGAGAVFSGESSPEKAVAAYLRASVLYDVDGMVEHASEYQKQALYDGQYKNDRELKKFLNGFYKDISSLYADSEISFVLEHTQVFEKDSEEFELIAKKYSEKADASRIKKVARVKMSTVIDGKKQSPKTYIAVKCGLRWFYGYADA